MSKDMQRIFSDNRAVSAVEFALIAPVMILMICGFMEYAHVGTARTTLEAATMRAARAVAASDCPSKRNALMLSLIENAMSGVPAADGTKVQIITKAYGDKFGNVGEPEPFADANGNKKWDVGESYVDVNGNGTYDKDMGSEGSIGGVGQVVSYTSRFQVASLFNFVSNQFNGSDSYTIEATTVMRNEPIFSTTGCP